MAGNDFFADRAFITVNGFELVHLKSARVQIDENLRRVDTMTRNYRSAGYKRGNKHVRLSIEVEIPADKAQIDLALKQQSQDANMVFELGGERYAATGLEQASQTMQSQTGDGSKSIELEALDIVNENGTSVISDLSLG
jgi:hypothetical protein